MPYVVVKQTVKDVQISWDDILAGKVMEYPDPGKRITGTVTRLVHVCPKKMDKDIDHLVSLLQKYAQINQSLYEVDRHALYHRFYIPKAHGGKREINEPCPELMSALNQLRYLLERACGALYHTSAFAYIPGRCTRDMDMKHALNESNWFLKTDFKNFFPSINLNFTMHMLSHIYPFSSIVITEQGRSALEKALSLAFLDDGLPQGSPVSPCISNLVMIPIDYELFNFFSKKRFIYTRYADDITVSCKQAFDAKSAVQVIRNVLSKQCAPFGLNEEKTKYVSNKGSNWMLGLMINKDHQVTVGHKRKKYLKASLCNFIKDIKNGKPWMPEDATELQGQLAYYRMVEKPYMDYVVGHMNHKFHVNTDELLRQCIAGKL